METTVIRNPSRATGPALIIALLPGLFWACGGSTEPGTPPEPVTIVVPGFPPMPETPDNPLTRQGIELGRRLFYDPILSGDHTQSCGSCHAPEFAFTDHGKRVSVGIDDIEGTRSTPAIINAAWSVDLFWDGRAEDLEEQAMGPVPNPIEMHLEWEEAERRLQAHAEYPAMFQAAFGTDKATAGLTVKAIAQFERTLVSGNSRYDRWKRGLLELGSSELRGMTLFFTERGDCFHCHPDGFFTDQLYHNTGLDASFEDIGREEVTGHAFDRGKFKSPTLRNIAFTAPYMHDGRFDTLEDAVKHYNNGGVGSPNVDPLIRVGTGLGLDPQDVLDIVAFLHALSDSSFITNPDFASPFPAP